MSKKGKPTQAIMIEVSGNTVWAHVVNAYGQHLECVAGYAKCHPNDTFDFYEGAALPWPAPSARTVPEDG